MNFEPDIRSNFLAWLTGAPRRVGYWTGGGGAFLTDALAYDADDARRRKTRACSSRRAAGRDAARSIPRADHARARAAGRRHDRARRRGSARRARPLVGVHVSGGRESKQWHLDRFASVARELAGARGATIVLTGSDGGSPDGRRRRAISPACASSTRRGALDLPTLAALLARLDLLVTGDTGPMHLAAAMGTPVVALFGPSHPERYGPLASLAAHPPRRPAVQSVRTVRLPPERCRGHVPDCMDGITVDASCAAAIELLDAARPAAGRVATA